jgi:hypothetical protein
METSIRKPAQRPVIITIICIIGFVLYGILFVLGLITLIGVAALFGGIGAFVGILLLAVTLLYLWPLIGYWNMRKWGPIFFTVLFAIQIILAIVNNSFASYVATDWIGLLINVAIIAIGFAYYKQMT